MAFLSLIELVFTGQAEHFVKRLLLCFMEEMRETFLGEL